MIPLEQALARDFAKALEALRSGGREAWLGPDGKALVVVRGRHLVAVSLSLHHVPAADWLALCALAKEACLAVAAEYVAALELEPPGDQSSGSIGAGSFDVGGPLGDNGLSGKKLVAEAFGTAVPIGGGTVHGKDPHKPDVRAQRLARERAVDLVRQGHREATVWVVFRPGTRSRGGWRKGCVGKAGMRKTLGLNPSVEPPPRGDGPRLVQERLDRVP